MGLSKLSRRRSCAIFCTFTFIMSAAFVLIGLSIWEAAFANHATPDSVITFDLGCIRDGLSSRDENLDLLVACEIRNRGHGHRLDKAMTKALVAKLMTRPMQQMQRVPTISKGTLSFGDAVTAEKPNQLLRHIAVNREVHANVPQHNSLKIGVVCLVAIVVIAAALFMGDNTGFLSPISVFLFSVVDRFFAKKPAESVGDVEIEDGTLQDYSASGSHLDFRSRHGQCIPVMEMAVEADDRVKAVEEALEKEKEESARNANAPLENMPLRLDGPSVYPLAGIVGQEAIKTALLLCGVNPKVGGLIISGGRGTAKSVMARALHTLMPPIDVVKGSAYNIDPSGERPELDTFLAEELAESGKSVKDLETEVIPAPLVQLPVDVLEDRLFGSVDIEKSLKTGKTTFEPGLLANAHRGVLYIDDMNLLDDSITNLLLEAIGNGWVNVEREGLSVRYPCKPLLIATYNPEESDLRDHLADRFGMVLAADAEEMTQEDRLEAVSRAIEFSANPPVFISKYEEETDQMKTNIVFAREYIKGIKLAKEQIKYLCESATRAGCQGHRAEIFASQVARAAAALNGEDRVSADDLKLAVKMCIIPRGTEIYAPPEDEMMEEPPMPPPPPPQQNQEEEQEEEQQEQEEPEEAEEDQVDAAPEIPEEFMIDAEGVAMDPDVLKFASKARTGRSGSRGMVESFERGRYIKPMIPKGKIKKIAIDATLRTAAPYQKGRRERALENNDVLKTVYLKNSDVRVKKMQRKSGSLVIFVVDASGSMALNRMNVAKGAAIDLLVSAYQNRDKVCVISFQGEFAEVVLPPTKSTEQAKSRLEKLPCGGGSPFAHGLNLAMMTGLQAQKSGDVGEILVICISDGRANVPLDVSLQEKEKEDPTLPDKKGLMEELLETAGVLGQLPNFKFLMLDTENKFVSTGAAKEIAAAANGRYHYIPKASQGAVSVVAGEALADMRSARN